MRWITGLSIRVKILLTVAVGIVAEGYFPDYGYYERTFRWTIEGGFQILLCEHGVLRSLRHHPAVTSSSRGRCPSRTPEMWYVPLHSQFVTNVPGPTELSVLLGSGDPSE